VDRILFLKLFIGLLAEYLLHRGAFLSQFFIQISFQNLMVEGLQNTVNMVAHIELSVRIDQILTQGLEEFGRFVLSGVRVENLDFF